MGIRWFPPHLGDFCGNSLLNFQEWIFSGKFPLEFLCGASWIPGAEISAADIVYPKQMRKSCVLKEWQLRALIEQLRTLRVPLLLGQVMDSFILLCLLMYILNIIFLFLIACSSFNLFGDFTFSDLVYPIILLRFLHLFSCSTANFSTVACFWFSRESEDPWALSCHAFRTQLFLIHSLYYSLATVLLEVEKCQQFHAWK